MVRRLPAAPVAVNADKVVDVAAKAMLVAPVPE
jgi:hypothetical protein